jgi:hypothetical protein
LLLGKYKGGGLAYNLKHGLKIYYAAWGLLDIPLRKIVKRLLVGVSQHLITQLRGDEWHETW